MYPIEPAEEHPDSTPSIEDGPQVELKVKGSRFLGRAFASENETDTRATIAVLKKRTYDASHHCWALRAGSLDAPIELCDDDGEPSGTAGPPILSALQKSTLTDALVVVTRYFGGTKLGRGGLVRAYRECAEAALAAAPRRTIWHDVLVIVSCDFDDIGNVEAVVSRRAQAIRSVERDFATQPTLRVGLRRSAAAGFTAEVTEATAGRATVQLNKDA